MKFPFSFPTLQHLARLRIAVHMANAKIGPYGSFPEAVWDKSMPARLQDSELEGIVTQLRISERLQPMFAAVFTGVFHQLCQWLTKLGRCMDGTRWKEHFVANFRQMELVFDVHGRLDVTAIWDRYFSSKMATTSKVKPLLELMEAAVFHQQLNHLDTILRKLVDICDTGTELDGPSYTISEGEILKMRYVFKQRRSQSTFRVLRSKFNQHIDSAFVDEDGITIMIFGTWMNLECFQTYLKTVGERSISFGNVVDIASDQSVNSTREVMETLNETEFNALLRSLPYRQCFLEDFVVWPFSQFVLLPMLQGLTTNQIVFDYVGVFQAIVNMMPLSVHFGAYSNDIFLEFWNGLRETDKRSLWNSLRVNFACLGTLRRRNPALHKMVVQEMQALLGEDHDLVVHEVQAMLREDQDRVVQEAHALLIQKYERIIQEAQALLEEDDEMVE